MTSYQRVTAEDCATHASILRKALAQFGVNPNPASDLGKMIAALEWFGSFPAEAFQPDAAWAVDKDRAMRAFVLFEQAKRTAVAVGWALAIPGSAQVVVRLKKKLNRLEGQDEQALDYFFELDIAHRLAKRGVSVAFEEPDLVLGGGKTKIGLACKRPRNAQSLRDRLREGASQVTKQPFPGMIVIGLEAILHMSDDPAKPTVTYVVDSPDQLDELVKPIIDDTIAGAQRDVQAAFDQGIGGVLFCGLATGVARRIVEGFGGPIFKWFRRPISNPSYPGVAELLDDQIFGSISTEPARPETTTVGSEIM